MLNMMQHSSVDKFIFHIVKEQIRAGIMNLSFGKLNKKLHFMFVQ